MDRDDLRAAIVHALADREEVTAIWLDGSLARGTGDDHSDVDLGVVVSDDTVAAFLDALPTVLGEACDPVLLRFYGRLAHVVTEAWLRADLLVRTVSDVQAGLVSPVVVLHDPTRAVRVVEHSPPNGPDPDRVRNTIEEFLRFLGLLPIAAARSESIGGYIATGQMTAMLTDLMQFENGTNRVGGALRLGERLTPEQKQSVMSLPPLAPDGESVVRVHLALAQAFLPRARRLARALDLEYPERAEKALLAHLRRHGIEVAVDQ